MCPCIVWASCARVGVQASATSRMDAPDDEKVKAQPVSGLEDQRAPRPVEPEVLAYDGDVLAREAYDVPVPLAPKARGEARNPARRAR